MGKATIISGGTDGLYTIKIDAGSQQQASRLETIETSLASVLERIPEAQAEYLAATTKETYAAGALNAAIENYAAAVQANPETASTTEVDRLTGDYYAAARFAGEARTRLQDLTLQQRQLESDKAKLTNAPVSETRQAWCADLTEDAAGEVATIEVPGEPGTVLVAPGGRAPSAGDGALVARELMTPEQAFFNAAILPGWQKWMPTFRTGTITAINSDNDTADVSLDDATSSAQGLGVNQTSSLSGVPVEYMECNAAAFEVGDPCVVRFDGQSWDAPRVVGFAREPKACTPAEYLYLPIDFSDRYWRDFVIVEERVGYQGIEFYDQVCSGWKSKGKFGYIKTQSIGDVKLNLPDGRSFVINSGGTVVSVSGSINAGLPYLLIGDYDHIKTFYIFTPSTGYVGAWQEAQAEYVGSYPTGFIENNIVLGGPVVCLGPRESINVYDKNNDYKRKVSYFNTADEFDKLMRQHYNTPPNFSVIRNGKNVEYVFDGWGNKGRYIKTPSTLTASPQARYKPAKYAK